MQKWFESGPSGFGEGKVYDTTIEDKLLEEMRQTQIAQAANIKWLKHNRGNGDDNKAGNKLKKKKNEVSVEGSRVMEGEAQTVGQVVPGCASIETKLPLIWSNRRGMHTAELISRSQVLSMLPPGNVSGAKKYHVAMARKDGFFKHYFTCSNNLFADPHEGDVHCKNTRGRIEKGVRGQRIDQWTRMKTWLRPSDRGRNDLEPCLESSAHREFLLISDCATLSGSVRGFLMGSNKIRPKNVSAHVLSIGPSPSMELLQVSQLGDQARAAKARHHSIMAAASFLRGASASVRASSQGSSSALCFVSSRKAVADFADVTSHMDTLDFPVSPSATVLKPSLLQPRVVVYDGVCHLCHRGVKWVIGADKHRKIKFCCVQSKSAKPYLEGCGLDREDVLRRFLFVEGAGAYHVGSSAALKVMSYLPLPYSALGALLVVPLPLRDAVYDHIAKKRYDWFGKEEECLVMREQDMLDRFIDRDEILERSRTVL